MTDSQSPLESSAVTTDPSPVNSAKTFDLLFGGQGLRSGWGFFLYLMLAYVLVVFLQKALAHVMHGLSGTLWPDMTTRVVLLVCVVLPAILLSRLEKRPFGAYGLPAQGAYGKFFWLGMVWGFAALSALLLALRGAHVFYFGTISLHGARAVKFAAFWGIYFLLVGFFEEFLFRGYTLFTLSRGIGFLLRILKIAQNASTPGFWLAAIALSVLFGVVHLGNSGESWMGAAAAAGIAFFFCLTLRRTGTLWFAVGFHASWDWAESYFYGVPDSGGMIQGHLMNPSSNGPVWLTGGSVGPEGSLLVFVVIGSLMVAFHVLHPAAKADLA